MWPFGRIKLVDSGVFDRFYDGHSHILPGVDDGLKTFDASLQVLDFYSKLGISKVCCTPHVMEEMPNETQKLKENFDVLQSIYSGEIELCLSAEYMMDNVLTERLENEDLLPYGPQQKHLLVETSYFNAPLNMDNILEKVRACGLIPVLAHPERYSYMSHRRLCELNDKGVLFQMNLVSLTGCYGKEARKRAEWMYLKGMYSFFGTDLHSLEAFKERIKEKIRIEL